MKKLLNSALFFIIFFCVCQLTKAEYDNEYKVKTAHPRLIMTKEAELNLRFILLDNQIAGNMKNNLKADAEKLMDAKALKIDDEQQENFYKVSKEYFYRILTLSIAYRIFEEDKYAESAIEQMLYVAEIKDWIHQDFKNASTLTAAVGIGYDALYYSMDRGSREVIRNAIVEKGLKVGLAYLKNNTDSSYATIDSETLPDKIVGAGGLILGSLSVADFFPELNTQILYNSLKSLQSDLMQFDLQKQMDLDIGKWRDMQNFLSMMVLSLNNSLGHDFGITGSTAFKTAAQRLTELSSETQGEEYFQMPAMFWYSTSFSEPGLAAMYIKNLRDHVIPQNGQPLPAKQYYYLNLAWFANVEENLTVK